MDLSAHHRDKAIVITQITFKTGDINSGKTLGQVLAAAGENGAQYQDYIDDLSAPTAFLSGQLNAQQRDILKRGNASISASSPEEMQAIVRIRTNGQNATLNDHIRAGTFNCD